MSTDAALTRRGCAGSSCSLFSSQAARAADDPRPPTPLQREITGLAERWRTIHPEVDHQMPLQALRAEARALADAAPGADPRRARRRADAAGALPGERDGHTAAYFRSTRTHARPFHVFPLRCYDFADGVHVVARAGQCRECRKARCLRSTASRSTRSSSWCGRSSRTTTSRGAAGSCPSTSPRRGAPRARDRRGDSATYRFADGSEADARAGRCARVRARSAARPRPCR